jgi:RNA polymerase sigma-70 factor (ECF subfamily)
MDYPADQALLTRLRAGEQKAYRELVATYQGAMRAVAFAIVGSRNADEVVQDAWLWCAALMVFRRVPA